MDRKPSATVSFGLWGTLANTLRPTCTWYCCSWAWGNSSWKPFSNPGRPSIIPKTTRETSSPLLLRSLNNFRQQAADSLSPICHGAYKIVLDGKSYAQPNRVQKHQMQPVKIWGKQPKKIPKGDENPSLKGRPKSLLGRFQLAPFRRSAVARLRRSLTEDYPLQQR